METGQALVIISGRMKFVTWIPDFTEMYPCNSKVYKKKKVKKRTKRSVGYFDIQKYVREKKKEKLEQQMSGFDSIRKDASPFSEALHPGTTETGNGINIDELVKRIDEKIAELEKEEQEEDNANGE